MPAARIPKTNAARLLEGLGIQFSLHHVEVDEEDLSAVSMARKLDAEPERVFKTLVARGDKNGVLMACIPAAAELDLKALAAASGNKHAEMVPLKEVRPLTGYIRGGCSPIGMKKQFVTVLDESCLPLDTIVFSAGKIGMQIEMDPRALIDFIGAKTAAITAG